MARHRIRAQRFAEPIAHALTLIPEGILRRIDGVEFVAGVDPLYAGVHTCERMEDGRSYQGLTCCVHGRNQAHRPRADRAPKVVLPIVEAPWVVIHELGHVLDEAIDWQRRDPTPVTAYAQTNRFEAFAEAFAAWLVPDVYTFAQPYLLADEQTLALFEELSR